MEHPYPIDRDLATRGKALFEAKCMGCHGSHERDADGMPIYLPPRVIPLRVVRTDPERLQKLDAPFLDLIKRSPLSDVIQQTDHQESYAAPRLHGIWARFPCLHNASVPTIHDLLLPAKERTAFFSLSDAGEEPRFDPIRLGLNVQGVYAVSSKPLRHDRSIYDTTLSGQTNVGHEFHTDMSEEERRGLIGYLKSL